MVYAPLLFCCGFLGFTGVVAGAYGSHGLNTDDAAARAAFVTAGHYQLMHSMAALACVAIAELLRAAKPEAAKRVLVSAWLLLVGVGLFAGTIYACTLGAPKQIGIFAPIGGLTMMAGWCCQMLAALYL